VDPNNIDEVYFGSQQAAGPSRPNFVLVIHVKQPVKPDDVKAWFMKGDSNLTFAESKVGRYTVYDGQFTKALPTMLGTVPPTAPSFLMPDDKRVVEGPSSQLHAVLQRDKKPDFSDKLQAAIKATDFTATVAFAATKDAVPKQALNPGQQPGNPGIKNPFAPPPISWDKVDGMSLTAKVGTDVDVSATALCQDAQSASDLREGIQKNLDFYKTLLAGLSLVGQGLPPELSDLLDISPQATGSTLTVSKTIKVAPLIKYAKEQAAKQAVIPAPGKGK
jgi:hypothetical protein